MLDRLKRLDDQMLEAQKEHQPGPQCVWAVKEKHRETKHHKTRCVNYFPYVLLLKHVKTDKCSWLYLLLCKGMTIQYGYVL